MTTKTTFIGTAPDGSTITRKTARAYTHAVVVRDSVDWAQGAYDRSGGTSREWYAKALAGAKAGKYGALAFCGRYDLAVKAADKARKMSCYADVQIVEVHPA